MSGLNLVVRGDCRLSLAYPPLDHVAGCPLGSHVVGRNNSGRRHSWGLVNYGLQKKKQQILIKNYTEIKILLSAVLMKLFSMKFFFIL